MVNILLRAFKSFNTIYHSVYTFGYNNLFLNTHANFHAQFILQSIVSNQFKTNKYAIYHKSFQYFIINFETMKEECRSNFHKFETRERLKNKPKKVVVLRFLSSESRSWVKFPRHQPLIHHKYVTIKEQPKKEKSVVHSRIFG